jgi:hypothetical protein
MNCDIEVYINQIATENTNPNFCQREQCYQTAKGSSASYEYNQYGLLVGFNVKKLWKKYNNYKYQDGIIQEYITEIHTKTDKKTFILQNFPDHKFIKTISMNLLKNKWNIRREYPE